MGLSTCFPITCLSSLFFVGTFVVSMTSFQLCLFAEFREWPKSSVVRIFASEVGCWVREVSPVAVETVARNSSARAALQPPARGIPTAV